MPNAVEYVTFTLKKGVSISNFLLASEKMNSGFLHAQKGYVSRQLLADGDTWADWILWETMEDALSAAEAFGRGVADRAYASFIENWVMRHFTVKQSFMDGR